MKEQVRAITERGIRCHLRYNILGGTCKHRCFYLPSLVRALPPMKRLVSLASQTCLVVRYMSDWGRGKHTWEVRLVTLAISQT